MTWLDVMTLAIIVIVVAVSIFFMIWLAGLPGRLANDRQHPQAAAINALGWLSFLTFFATWPIAIVWAYARPANVAIQKTSAESSKP
jgi:hypothetical protein